MRLRWLFRIDLAAVTANRSYGELQCCKTRIDTALRQQHGVGTLFDDASIFQHQIRSAF